MTYKKVVEKFLVYLEAKGDSATTVGTYQQRLRLFLIEAGLVEDDSLLDFTPEMMDSWVVSMRRRGLAPDTIRSRVRDVKHFFRWCENRNYLHTSPAKHMVIKGRAQLVVKAMKPENLKKLLAVASHYTRDDALIRFIASTGCRAGEVAALKLSNLDLKKRDALVTGKSGSRFVDFDKETAVSLLTWIEEHPNPDTDHVFVGYRSPHQPITAATVYSIFRRLATKAGIESERFNPHSIRHLVGKKWVEEANLELARQKLGHADISTTAIYANQDRERVKLFTDKIEILKD